MAPIQYNSEQKYGYLHRWIHHQGTHNSDDVNVLKRISNKSLCTLCMRLGAAAQRCDLKKNGKNVLLGIASRRVGTYGLALRQLQHLLICEFMRIFTFEPSRLLPWFQRSKIDLLRNLLTDFLQGLGLSWNCKVPVCCLLFYE